MTGNSLAGMTAAAKQIGDLTAQQVLAQATADAAFIAMLTSDQLTKYNSLRQAGVGGPGDGGSSPGGKGPGGPGGPGGPPPPKK